MIRESLRNNDRNFMKDLTSMIMKSRVDDKVAFRTKQ